MVRYDNLWNKVVSFDNFYDGYLEAIKGRRFKPEIMQVSQRVEMIIQQLIIEMENGAWQPQTYYEFESRTEVKRRIIHAPTFRDRIVHHALDRIVRPLFEKKFIFDSYACRKGKGTHKATQRVQDFLVKARAKYDKIYVLQCDISKYYPSIDHEILKTEIRRTIKDKGILWLWDSLIDRFNEDTGKGIPIGSLISQLSANIYLNPLDHFVKECIGAKFYVRYMDDFIILAGSKEELWDILDNVRWFTQCKLNLKLNPKTRVYPASRGIDFAGYRIFADYLLPRKRNIKAAKLRFKDISWKYRHGKATKKDVDCRVASFLGYCKHCKSLLSAESALKRLNLEGSINNGKNSID